MEYIKGVGAGGGWGVRAGVNGDVGDVGEEGEEGPEEVEVGGFADLRLDSRKLARGGRSLTPLRVDPSMAFWSCRSQTKHMSNILSILGFDSFTVYLLFSNWQCPWQYLITKYINHLPIHVRHHMQ